MYCTNSPGSYTDTLEPQVRQQFGFACGYFEQEKMAHAVLHSPNIGRLNEAEG
jgi:hypothetical protein